MSARAGLLGALALALGLRIVAIDHGLPWRYVPDTHVIRGALGMAQTRDFAPPPGRFTSYPYLLPYLLLPVFGAVYIGGKALGAWQGPEEFARSLVFDATPVVLPARWLVVLLSLLGVFATARLARSVLGRGASVPAALLAGTSFWSVHLAHSARPWAPLMALFAWAADRAVSLARAPTPARAILAGAAAGLCAACHQTGLLAAALPAAALCCALARGLGLRRFLGGAALAASAFGAVALLLGYPYVLLGRAADVGVEGSQAALDLGGQSFAWSAFGLGRAQAVWAGLVGGDAVLVVLALIGVSRCVRRGGAAAWVVLGPAAAWLALFTVYEGAHPRYLTPVLPLLCVPAAAALSASGRPALRRAAALLLLFPLALGLRYGWLLGRPDTRTEMLAVVARVVPEGATVAVEPYGPPLRPNARSLARLAADGRPVARRERWLAEDPREDPLRPRYDVVPLERYYRYQSVWPHQWLLGGEKPIETFLDERGVEYVITSNRDPGPARNSALDPALARRGRRLHRIDPRAGGWFADAPAHARLPADPVFPALDLLSVERPGPLLELWRWERP